jgi:DedD protein
MGLLSFFQRGNRSAPAAAEAGDPVQVARVRARQRLIGAAVLVIAGVIGFPLVFETQPRPVPIDTPIEIPRRDAAAPLVLPAPRTPAAQSASGTVSAAREELTTETRAEAGKPVAAPVAPPAPAPSAMPASSAASTPAAPAAPEPATRAAAAAKPAATAEAARARALLEGKPAAKADEAKEAAGRFVVQVGAFADAAAARETRAKVEKLGLKTYTQVVETASGSRTRVRVGPFASRDEADKALAKARDAGINAVVLTL